MKAISKTVVLFVILFIIAACSTTKVTQERSNEVTRKIQSKEYTVQANYAQPMRGKQIYLNHNYDLKIKNDSAFAFLPYFGVAYSAPYGGGEGGIKFSEPVKDYTANPNKRNDGWDIRFKIDAREHNYDIFMTVFNNGSATITVNSYQRDPISFSGKLNGLKSK